MKDCSGPSDAKRVNVGDERSRTVCRDASRKTRRSRSGKFSSLSWADDPVICGAADRLWLEGIS